MLNRNAVLVAIAALVAACSSVSSAGSGDKNLSDQSGNGSATPVEREPEKPPEPARAPPPAGIELAGVVKGPDGNPVAGAFVAVVPAAADDAKVKTTTDGSGRFTASVPAGSYAFTVTAQGRNAGYRKPEPIDASWADKPVELVLDADSITLSGQVADLAGTQVAGASVRITRISDDQGDIFYARTDGQGRYQVRLPKGQGFSVELDGGDHIGKGTTSVGQRDEVVDVRAFDRSVALGPASTETISWLKQNAVPLATAEAGQGLADMQPIADMVGDARLVSLGEATHGTREFFQLKHRMLEFLVETKGFTVFAIEANFPESLAVNEYVLTGRGDPRKALAGMYFWTWNTEEVLALIEWMRRYNADPAHKRKLHFYGYDMQTTKVAYELVVEYLDKVDKSHAATIKSELALLGDLRIRREFAKLADADKQKLRETVAKLEERLDRNKRRYVRKSSKRAWQLNRQHAVILRQAVDMHSSSSPVVVRDKAMADNLQWIYATQPRGTKIVSWAHNGHASRKGFAGIESMGTHLHQALGEDQVIFGFVFNRGSFQAMNWTQGRNKPGGLTEHTVRPAPVGYYGAEFARVGHPMFVLDMRTAPAGSPVARWLQTPHMMRAIGAIFSGEQAMAGQGNLSEDFDAVIFVDKTSRARPNPDIEEPAKAEPQKPADKP